MQTAERRLAGDHGTLQCKGELQNDESAALPCASAFGTPPPLTLSTHAPGRGGSRALKVKKRSAGPDPPWSDLIVF
jgi:hypothetical protein